MDDYYLTTLFMTPFIGLAIYNYQSISNYLIKSLYYCPGEGEIYK